MLLSLLCIVERGYERVNRQQLRQIDAVPCARLIICFERNTVAPEFFQLARNRGIGSSPVELHGCDVRQQINRA